MMNKLILEALSALNVPVAFQKYSGSASTYVTFHEYLASGEQYEDDLEAFTSHYIQVDVWSKDDYNSLVKDLKLLLQSAGLYRLDEADLYEPDTNLYHKGLRFFYLEEQED